MLSNNRHPERPRRFSQALGVPLPGPRGQAEAGGFLAGHGDKLYAGADSPPWGISSPIFWAGGTPRLLCWWSLPPGGQSGALPALRSGVALPHVEQKEDKTVMSALRPGGQRRVLSL